MSHQTEGIIITCIDFRFQKAINKWITGHIRPKIYDRVAIAGGVYDLYTVLKQVEISKRLHKVKKAIFINHEDCGAYGEAGTPEKHAKDLRAAKTKIKEQYPDLKVETYYLHLDGTFELIS